MLLGLEGELITEKALATESNLWHSKRQSSKVRWDNKNPLPVKMSYYVSPYCPEHLFPVRSRNERKARYMASQELCQLVNENPLRFKMPNGISTRQLIKVHKSALMPKNKEGIYNAVETLAQLTDSRKKLQDLHDKSLEAHQHINSLFEKDRLTDEEFTNIKESLKVIKKYATAFSAYKEANSKAEVARAYLKEVLESPE